MLAGLFSYLKRHFYLSENNRHIMKMWAKKHIPKSHLGSVDLRRSRGLTSLGSEPARLTLTPKSVGDNRSSEEIVTETFCWVPLLH